MAKKSTSSDAEEFSFMELDNFLTKNVDDRGSIVTDNSFSKIDEFISSGNYMLNAQLSGSLFGGYANSRATALCGPSGCGKSFLALNAAREAQAMGYNIIWCDSEAAQDVTTFENFGVDPKKVRYQPVATPLEFKVIVSNLIKKLKEVQAAGKKLPKIMLVLDSLGNLATTKERDDAASGSEKKDMTKASEMRSLFRVITMDLASVKIPLIFTNHSYACMTGETLVTLKDGSIKQLKDVNIGEEVLTAEGSSVVEDKFEMNAKKTFRFTLEDGTVLQCTPNHCFAVETKDGEVVYKAAEDLADGDTILCKDSSKMGITKVELIDEPTTVYDIQVKDVHNYVLSNGVISHNSVGAYVPTQTMSGGGGPIYCASTILMLSKAGLSDVNKEEQKQAENVGMTKTGIRVTSKPEKSRFAKPIPVKFHISFYKGMNPYVGLEEYVTWENCGIGVGKLQTEKDFKLLTEKEQEAAKANGQVWTDSEGNFIFVNLKDSLRNKVVIVKKGDKVETYPLQALFTKQVITDEVLHDIDEKIIKPMFQLSGGVNTEADSLAEMAGITDDSEDE